MRRALVVAVALALAGCGDLFDTKAPQGYACSSTNSCPPGQECVPGEHVCRTPCTQTSTTGMIGPMTNGQCQNIDSGSSGSNSTGWNCDYDHFCRPACNGGGGSSMCGGCSGTDVCDTTINVCRPACAGGCPAGWGCIDFSNSGFQTAGICVGCRPDTGTTFLPPKFADPVYYDAAGSDGAGFVAIGDLGGGHASLVASDDTGNRVNVYASDNTGTLAPPVAYSMGLPSPRQVVILDLTRDGKPDVVVGTVVTGGSSGPVLLPGNGDGTLGAPVQGPRAANVRLITGDFDGDSKPDIAGCGGYNELDVLTSDGAGGMKILSSITLPNAEFQHLGAADFNGDGKLDLWGDDQRGSLSSFINNGAMPPSFGTHTGGNLVGGTRSDAISFDVDGDKKPDMVIVQSMPGGGTSGMIDSLVIAKGDGTGGFSTSGVSNQIVLPALGQVVSGDFDGDGHLDVALLETPSNGKSNIDILSGNGATLIYSESIHIAKDGPLSIAAGDLDGDGKPDLVVGLSTGVVVFMNQSPSR